MLTASDVHLDQISPFGDVQTDIEKASQFIIVFETSSKAFTYWAIETLGGFQSSKQRSLPRG